MSRVMFCDAQHDFSLREPTPRGLQEKMCLAWLKKKKKQKAITEIVQIKYAL